MSTYPFINYPLPYSYDALEPFIDKKTMELHHNKHLQTYIDNLNNILKDCPKLQNTPLEKLVLIPVKDIFNNAGGVYNHQFFFNGLIPSNEFVNPSDSLMTAIQNKFQSFDNFKDEFKKSALSVFGSGYCWLVLDKFKNLKIVTTPNQNTPLPNNLTPILNLDTWEHAYYLKYYNVRSNYIDNWFNIINWAKASEYFDTCVKI